MPYRISYKDIKEAAESRDLLQLTSMRQQLEFQIAELQGKLTREPTRVPKNSRYRDYETWSAQARKSLAIMRNHLELVEVAIRDVE